MEALSLLTQELDPTLRLMFFCGAGRRRYGRGYMHAWELANYRLNSAKKEFKQIQRVVVVHMHRGGSMQNRASAGDVIQAEQKPCQSAKERHAQRRHVLQKRQHASSRRPTERAGIPNKCKSIKFTVPCKTCKTCKRANMHRSYTYTFGNFGPRQSKGLGLIGTGTGTKIRDNRIEGARTREPVALLLPQLSGKQSESRPLAAASAQKGTPEANSFWPMCS